MTHIQLRRDTSENWNNINPILLDGEVGIDTTNNNIRIGNGTSNYLSLPTVVPAKSELTKYSFMSSKGISLSIGPSGTQLIAPDTGYLYMNYHANIAGAWASIDNLTLGISVGHVQAPSNGAYLSLIMQCRVGDTLAYYFDGSTIRTLIFKYAVGTA